ncbi:CDP-alcohol phosphatidyltransferase family protein [Gammaproteobacteria bacterium]|jgi:CDP-diacylglycerol--glycerol-3-phosphate 3-phosphatidyltransferase|nr:CDP-alcohol phosphatidyltransferase family protein [Gammaproteobacteria bacterium]MDC0129018.1 CDP-alcohol phosphatidyltransferase family protein [Gammaproteobacteria bacterium]
MNNFIQILTYFRIVAGPIIFLFILVFQSYGIALSLLLLASATDYWDGYLARKYSLTSVLGAILDPIADKILITFVLIALVLALESIFIAFLGSIILAREFWVGALRDLNARNKNEAATNVTFLAKIKTTMQLGTFCWILTGLYLNSALMIFLGNFFLCLVLIITIQTGLSYTIATFKK